MIITHKLKLIFNLTEEEVLILKKINSVPQRTSDLEKELCATIPRTTLIRYLTSLHRRGFVAKHKYGDRRSGWIEGDLEKKLDYLQKQINETRGSERAPDKDGVNIYKGKKEMMVLADTIFNLRKGEKLFWLLPNQTKKQWGEKSLYERAIKFNQHLCEKGIIVEAIFGDSFLEHDIFYGGKKMLEGYLNRPTIIHTLPKQYLDFYSDIMIFREVVSIMNWKDEIAVEIKNKDLTLLFKSLIAFIQCHSERVNLQEKSKKMLGTI